VLFLEEHAGWLLVAHAVVGAFTVAVSTHLVVWLRRWRAGHAPRSRGVRRFAWLTLLGYAAAFTLGMLIYPVYKARVRVEYFENPTAILAAAEARASAGAAMAEFTGAAVEAAPPEVPGESEIARLGRLARWFDVKENWILVGLLLAAGMCLTLHRWDPAASGAGPLPFVRGAAWACALLAWAGALIGLAVAAARAVG
jgi:hypothetical protein